MEDDIQFNESLDALLANENLDEATNGTHSNSGYNSYFGVVTDPTVASPGGGSSSNVASAASSVSGSTTTYGMENNNMQATTATTTTTTSMMMGHHHNHHLYAPVQGTTTTTPIAPSGYHPHLQQQLTTTATGMAENVVVSYFQSSGDASIPSFGSGGASSRRGGSTDNGRSGTASGGATTNKRARENAMAVSEDEDDRDKRRQDRNLREQERSHKITEQIEYLRDVLASANIRFKPDKYSTLVTVNDYIRQLQERSALLDAEHKRLIETISKTSEVITTSRLAGSSSSSSSSSSISTANAGLGINPDSALSGEQQQQQETSIEEDEMACTIDYKNIFHRCGSALAVASVDGRFLDCTYQFEVATGYSRHELLPMESPRTERVADAVLSTSTGTPLTSGGGTSSIISYNEQKTGYGQGGYGTSGPCQEDQHESSSSSSEDGSSVSIGTNMVEKRNLSLFNILARDHMDEVFLALSDILKQAPDDPDTETNPAKKDCWNGIIRLNRNTHVEMRMTISLVRTDQGRAKFFDCTITPIGNQPLPLVSTSGGC